MAYKLPFTHHHQYHVDRNYLIVHLFDYNAHLFLHGNCVLLLLFIDDDPRYGGYGYYDGFDRYDDYDDCYDFENQDVNHYDYCDGFIQSDGYVK